MSIQPNARSRSRWCKASMAFASACTLLIGGWALGPRTAGATQIPPQSVTPMSSGGYWLAASDGGVFAYGVAFHGSAAGDRLAAPIVGIAGDGKGDGYWLVGRDGGIFAFGGAPFLGSAVGLLHSPAVGIDGDAQGGYVVAAADGATATFDPDAAPSTSPPPAGLDAAVVGVGVSPANAGGWYLATSRGQVVPSGPIESNRGDPSGVHLVAPVVGIDAGGANGNGYLLAAADGGVFTYGTTFSGSAATLPLRQPVVGVALVQDGAYDLVAADGGVFSFGGAPFAGSAGDVRLRAPVVGVALG